MCLEGRLFSLIFPLTSSADMLIYISQIIPHGMAKSTHIVTEQRRETSRLLLFALIAALPAGAGIALVTQGDSVIWAKAECSLRQILVPEATAQSVHYDFPSGWTSTPGWNVIVTDCDCPPPPPPDCSDGDGDSSDAGSSSDSDSSDSDCCP